MYAHCDHDSADEHDEFPHSSHNQVPDAVAPHNLEPVLGGHAEVLAPQSNLNVGGLVDELHDPLHAGQAAAQAVDQVLKTLVLVGTCLLSLLLEQLHAQLEELDEGQDEGPKGQTAKVVPESPPEAAGDRGVQLIIGAVAVVPHTAGGGNHEDADGLDQGITPQGGEDEVVQFEEAGVGVVSHFGEGVIRARSLHRLESSG